MIVEYVQPRWPSEFKSTQLQKKVLDRYFKPVASDTSRTVLIDCTWSFYKKPPMADAVVEEHINEHIVNYYSTLAGPDWPSLSDILSNCDLTTCSEFVQNEIAEFRQSINLYREQRIQSNKHCYEGIKQYLMDNPNAFDNVVLYNLVDPIFNDFVEKLFGFLKDFDCKVFKLGYFNDSDVWLDFHALIVKNFFVVDTNLDQTANQIDVPFMCLNAKPHEHRVRIVNEIQQYNLAHYGLVSLNGQGIDENVEVIMNVNSTQADAMSLGDIANWNRHFLNIVTETIYDVELANFWSEKTFKPIIGHRPFLIYAPNGATSMLARCGFEHYCNDFTDISDLDLREPNNIVPFLKVLCEQPKSYYHHKFQQLNAKINYNYNNLLQHQAKQWATVNRQ